MLDLLKDNMNIYTEPNRLIDDFVAKYSKILLDNVDRSVDYYNSGSSVGKTIPAIPQNVSDQFRYELTADVTKNSNITQTKSKFNQLIYFRFKYLNKDYGNTRTNTDKHTVESVAKAILNYFDYVLKIYILGDISKDMKAIRISIKNAISNQT